MREILFVVLLLAGCGEAPPDTARDGGTTTATTNSAVAKPMPAAPCAAKPDDARLCDGRALPADLRAYAGSRRACRTALYDKERTAPIEDMGRAEQACAAVDRTWRALLQKYLADPAANGWLAANPPRPEVPAPPPVTDYDYRRPGIAGLDSALRYRAKLSDGRATPTNIRQFLERLDACQYERIPRHAQMLSCAYTLREEMVQLQRKYRRDPAALAVFQDLALFGN